MKNLLASLLLLGATVANAGAGADDTVILYQLTGAIQCGDIDGAPPEKAADLLRAQGVRVTGAERRRLPIAVPDGCGAPTGEANLIEVSKPDWASFSAKTPDAGGYGLWVYDQETILVYQYDGTLQCGMGQEIALETTADLLASVGIKVVSSRKGSDGLSHIAVCGAATGAINVHEIPIEALPAARELGFRVLVTRGMAQQIKPRTPSSRMSAMSGVQSRAMPRSDATTQDSIPLLW